MLVFMILHLENKVLMLAMIISIIVTIIYIIIDIYNTFIQNLFSF